MKGSNRYSGLIRNVTSVNLLFIKIWSVLAIFLKLFYFKTFLINLYVIYIKKQGFESSMSSFNSFKFTLFKNSFYKFKRVLSKINITYKLPANFSKKR